MKRSASSSFKVPPRKKQKTQKEELNSLKRKVSVLERDIEEKWYDVDFENTIPFFGGSGYNIYQQSMVDMAAGDTSILRTGAQIKVKRLVVRATIKTNANYLTEPLSARAYVLIDKQCNGSSGIAPFTGGGGVGVYASGSTTVLTECAIPALLSQTRYRILKEKAFTFNSKAVLDYDPITGNTTQLVPMEIHFEWDFKNLNIPVQYLLNTGGSASILTNNISINIVTDSPFGDPAPFLTIATRAVFTDA